MHYSKVRIALRTVFTANIEQILVQWISGISKKSYKSNSEFQEIMTKQSTAQ